MAESYVLALLTLRLAKYAVLHEAVFGLDLDASRWQRDLVDVEHLAA